MKEEMKRYALIEYLGTEVRFFKKYSQYTELLETLRKYNNTKKGMFYFGNVSCEKVTKGMFKVVIHIYNRLTNKMTISDIDNLTSNKNDIAVINDFRSKIRTNKIFKPDIQIMYFEEKNKKDKTPADFDIRIKYIPVLYREDKRFMDKEYVKRCIHYEARRDNNIRFFKKMANEFCFYHSISDKIEKLRHYIDLCERGDYYFLELERVACDLYEAFIKERNSDKKIYRDENGECDYSKRRIRDFGFFIRDYMLPENKRISPVKYNQPVSSKQLEAFKNEQLRKEEDKNNQEEFKEQNVLQLSLTDYLKD